MVGRVRKRPLRPEELIRFALNLKPLFPVDEAYSDIGYLVLGRLIEPASGRSYYELLDEQILTPCNSIVCYRTNQAGR